MAEWYYIGHYGQLGPLTLEQMGELVEGGVILSDTYVWKTGMATWQTADAAPELRSTLQASAAFAAPPPPPAFGDPRSSQPQGPPSPSYRPPLTSYSNNPPTSSYAASAGISVYGVRSDKSRVISGILQLLLPGVGRMYLGYYAYGALQLVLALCTFGVLYLWSFIDGIIILSGGVKFDGFGRVLSD